MKKFFLSCAIIFSALTASAQNVQLHYDFGRNIYSTEEDGRQKVTLTLEQFKADKTGSWYYFVDLDMSRKNLNAAYTEISREFNLGKQSPIAAHIEYDGGLSHTSGSYQQAGLLGLAYNGHASDFSKTFSIQMLYKRFFASDHSSAYHSAQLTGVWSTTFAHKACTFSGFIDFWRGEQANGHGQLVVLSEPQFWVNLNAFKGLENCPISIGTEVEVSNNFIFNTQPDSDKKFFVNPTLALKWNL